VTGTVTELRASTGALVTFLKGSSYQFNLPVGVASDGTHVWVANQPCVFNNVYKCSNNLGNSVTELRASTGALVKVIKGSSYRFANPNAIASDRTHVRVVNSNNSVTELLTSTGALVKVIRGIEIWVQHFRHCRRRFGRHARLGD
jgi:hypothetical protein